jgi:nucleotide-binding universal stress UspA family protein
MDSILVATDFSANANVAAEYAVMLAKKMNAKVTLFHSYSILFPVPGIPKEITEPKEFGKAVEAELEKLAINLRNIAPGVAVDYLCKSGFPVDAITAQVNERKIDLVIMGIKGAGRISEMLAGSFTTDLIMKASFPVMVVPLNARFHAIKHIVFATNCHEIHNYESLNLLKEIAQHFSARINTIYIKQNAEEPDSVEKEAVHSRLDEYFEGMLYSFHEATDDDLVDALNEYIQKTETDIAVTIPRKHSFFESIFSGSNTKAFAFHTHVPLLALPDKD